MITDLSVLTQLCYDTLREREYSISLQGSIVSEWEALATWMQGQDIHIFSEDIGFRYCDEVLGGHIISKDMSKKTKQRLRSIRMLTSFQQNGEFAFRSLRIEWRFEGEEGNLFKEYLNYISDTRRLAYSTIRNKTEYLYQLYCYITENDLSIADLSVDGMESFFRGRNYTESSRHNAGSAIKLFLQYAYDTGHTQTDLSVCVLPDNYDRHSKLPTTYTETEIRNAIETVERTSSIGKRDYLVLLLAAEYGWRAKDITTFRFDEIDWDRNIICFDQHKM